MAIAAPTAGNRILASDLAAFYNLLKGVTGSGETVTLIYNAAPSLLFQPSSDPSAGTEVLQVKNSAGTVQSALSFDGRFYPADGLVGTPGVAFELDKDTGLYRVSTNTMAAVAGGAEKARWDATGFSADGGVTYLNVHFGDQVGRWLWDWDGKQTSEATTTGTGSVTAPAAVDSYLRLQTGATSGGTAGIRQRSLDGTVASAGVAKIRTLKIVVNPGEIDANTTWQLFMTNEDATTAPSNTARHLGIRQAAGVIRFSTADNTTEESTVITSSFTANTTTFIDITFDGTTARCYVSGALVATHATNVPGTATAMPILRAYIVNSAAANKNLYLTKVHMVAAV